MKLLLAYVSICLSPIYLSYQLKTKDYKSIKNYNLKRSKRRKRKEWE